MADKEQVEVEQRRACRHVEQEGNEVFVTLGDTDYCEFCYDNYREALAEARE